MVNKAYRSFLESAVMHYGADMQEDMAIEEMSELTQAIMHFRRGRKHNIAEEIADVEIMLEQLKIIHKCDAEVMQYRHDKIVRLARRIQEAKVNESEDKTDKVIDGEGKESII